MQTLLTDANDTIQNGRWIERISPQSYDSRQFVFFNLSATNVTKQTIVCVKSNGQCNIQSYETKTFDSVRVAMRSADSAVDEYLAEHLKVDANYDDFCNTLKQRCDEIGDDLLTSEYHNKIEK